MDAIQHLTRREKGKRISQVSRLRRIDRGWSVPSESGNGSYQVTSNGGDLVCTCPDHETHRNDKCKHIYAIEYLLTTTQVEPADIPKRPTYTQDWDSYNLSAQQEKTQFMKLLADVTSRIQQPAYEFGRPANPLGDTIYAMIFKVYSCYGGRKFAHDMHEANEKGFMSQPIPYNSMSEYFQKKELTSLLCQLVHLTSLPLRHLEQEFSADSTGFGTSLFQRWYSHKHGREISSRKWVKGHLMTGNKTQIVTGVEITTEFVADGPMLPALIKQTKEHFKLEAVQADKAFLSIENFDVITKAGAEAFIPFKSNSQPNGNGMLWKKYYYYFMLHNDEFLKRYHQRSNIEAANSAIKRRFGGTVRSKDWNAQVNEVLCKIIAYNICIVIKAMYQHGIKPLFSPDG